MKATAYVHFKVVVEVDEYVDGDDAFEQAVEILRDGGGDLIGDSVIDQKGNTIP